MLQEINVSLTFPGQIASHKRLNYLRTLERDLPRARYIVEAEIILSNCRIIPSEEETNSELEGGSN